MKKLLYVLAYTIPALLITYGILWLIFKGLSYTNFGAKIVELQFIPYGVVTIIFLFCN